MKKFLGIAIGLLFLCGAVIPATALATELVINGGFETGDFTGWIPVNAEIVKDPVHSGNYAAGLSVSEIRTEEKCRWGRCWDVEIDTNPASAILVQELHGWENTNQIFTGSFWYNVEELKDIWLDPRDDALYVGYLSILDGGVPEFMGGGALVVEGASDDWQFFEQTVDLSGESIEHLFLGFFFADGIILGSADFSSAFLDDVSVQVPEPATMLLLGLGLAGLAGASRKKLFKKS